MVREDGGYISMNPDETVIKIIKAGGIGVLPTDTLLEVVGSALIPETYTRND